MLLTCTVEVPPVPKARARVGPYGAHTPETTMQAEKNIRTYWGRMHHPVFAAGIPLRLYVEATLARPATGKYAGSKYPTGRPDHDNFMKLVSDALSKGVAYADDSQIVDGRCAKRWTLPGEAPHWWIVLESLD